MSRGGTVVGVVLAAGASLRMGRPKQLLQAAGETWVGRAVSTLRRGGAGEVVVVTGAHAREVTAALPSGVWARRNRAWREGQLSSARLGLRLALGLRAEVVLLSLVDHPQLRPGTVRRLLAFQAPVAAPALGGVTGHPLRLDARSARAVLRVQGAASLREALHRAGLAVRPMRTRDRGALANVNTPADRAGLPGA